MQIKLVFSGWGHALSLCSLSKDLTNYIGLMLFIVLAMSLALTTLRMFLSVK